MKPHIAFSTHTHTLSLLDQRRLPTREEYVSCASCEDIIFALQTMVVRGAPAIGVTAAYGCALAARQVLTAAGPEVRDDVWTPLLEEKLDALAAARPTAVNLAWAVARMRKVWWDNAPLPLETLITRWEDEAARVLEQDIAINRRMGAYGAELVPQGACIMTHCNAGALATGGFGTALGVIYAAHEMDKKVRVIANETRPFLQGARLTAYELKEEGVPVTVACDNACGLLMKKGMVDMVVVGADRIAANGDAANKIGTYGVALLAKEHNIPFYIAAPLSTIDLNTPAGDAIPIEERTPEEVTRIGETRITPDGVPVFNFAFDVTPARLITGIITEQGVLTPPYGESIKAAFARAQEARS